MTARNLSEDVLFVALAEERKIGDELKAVNELVAARKDCDVIVDFARVQIITSVNISNLIILHRLLKANGRQLIFCNVSFVTKCIFRVIGLSDVFNFAVDKAAALETLQRCAESAATSK